MRKIIITYFLFSGLLIHSQNFNINNDYFNTLLRNKILSGEINTDFSLNIRPLESSYFQEHFRSKTSLIKKNIEIDFLGFEYFVEYNTNHPYNRNNGSMIPNRGYQHLISPGFYFKTGLLSIKLKPEYHFSENRNFNGFWEGHYPVIWRERYKLWNHIDMPERHGFKQHNKILLGQSNILISWKKLSFGFSNENIWWGPSLRNSIMMSNHARGFNHITFNTNKPLQTPIGNFEWQFVTGKLENSGFNPPRTDYEFAGTKLFVPKINQNGATDDWRFFQGIILSYSPKWVDGFSLGFIRWVQMYSDLIYGKYWWMERNKNFFPVFQNLFRGKDKFEDYEAQTDQAAGIFAKWHWKKSKAEIYFEFYHNDSKNNLRDLILDSDHSRAMTIGLQKIFGGSNDFIFNWEWTQMEQNASRLLRNAGSWYEHDWVYDGYTNRGEVIGSSIGPGSNSQYFSVSKFINDDLIGFGIEVIENDNDFYHNAFSSAKDYRRYWKDFNIHLQFHKKFKLFNLASNLVYIRSLNYQWELNDLVEPYYHSGNDTNNFHLDIKLTYFLF